MFDKNGKTNWIFMAVIVIVAAGAIIGLKMIYKNGMGENVFNNPVSNPVETVKRDKPPISIDIADWQTYRNDKYGFEIKYPKDAQTPANKDAGGSDATGSSVDFIIYTSTRDYANIGFKIYEPIAGEQSLTLGQFVDKVTQKSEAKKPRTIGDNVAAIQVNFKDGIVQTGSNGWMARNENDIFVKGYNFYLIITPSPDSPEPELAEKVFSTFKFTKPQAVTKTEVVIYEPHRDSAVQYETVSGDCWIGSAAANRKDAYRCMSDSQISDPCFVLPNEKLLICDVDIATGKGGFLLQPMKGLPAGSLWPNNIPDWAIKIQLVDGIICAPITGTGFQIYDINQNEITGSNWSCGGSEAISGDLIVGDKWKANVARIKYDEANKRWIAHSVEIVDVAKVWR